jgi:hypothetical protein
VPITITAISIVLGSLQDRKILAMEERPMTGWLYRYNAHKKFERLLSISHRLLSKQILADSSKLIYRSPPGKELAAIFTDIESMLYLGRYNADKINVLAENLRRS